MTSKLTSAEHAIIDSAVRWTCNILTEVTGNYARRMSEADRQLFKVAISALQTIQGPDNLK